LSEAELTQCRIEKAMRFALIGNRSTSLYGSALVDSGAFCFDQLRRILDFCEFTGSYVDGRQRSVQRRYDETFLEQLLLEG